MRMHTIGTSPRGGLVDLHAVLNRLPSFIYEYCRKYLLTTYHLHALNLNLINFHEFLYFFNLTNLPIPDIST